MRKGIIVNLKRFKLLDYVTLNKVFILLCVLFITGITVGSVIYPKNLTIAEFAKNFFENYITVHNSNSFFKKLFVCFLKYLVVLLLYFLSGTSMLGVAVIPFLTVWQGIAFGNVSAYLYAEHALKGIAFNAIILVPPSIIFTICTFFAAKESINFSLLLAKLTLPKSKPANIYTDFRKYCARFIIFVAVSFVASMADVALNLLFLHFFDF